MPVGGGGRFSNNQAIRRQLLKSATRLQVSESHPCKNLEHSRVESVSVDLTEGRHIPKETPHFQVLVRRVYRHRWHPDHDVFPCLLKSEVPESVSLLEDTTSLGRSRPCHSGYPFSQ